MNAEQKLARDSELAVGLLLGPDGRDYMVNLEDPPPSWALPMDLRYIGVMGIRGGVVDWAPVDSDPETLRAVLSAVPAFVKYAGEKLAPKGDSVSWITRLAGLPDERG
jgi:hypothetical protein